LRIGDAHTVEGNLTKLEEVFTRLYELI